MAKEYLDKNGLSHFWSKIKAKLSTKQDTLTPGEGITINNNVISSSGGSTAITDSEIDDLWGIISGPGATTKDYIVEEGTSGGWTYRKWASGIAECWCREQGSRDIIYAWGSIYTSGGNGIVTKTYPTGLFIDIPTCMYSFETSGYNFWAVAGSASGTKDQAPQLQLARGTQNSGTVYYANWYARGFWKTFTPPIAASEDKLQADYIIEEGNANGWDYRKWASGTAECWQLTGESAFSYTSTYGNGFFRDSGNWHYPTDLFVSAPAVKITPIVSQGLIFATVYSNNKSYCKFYTASLKSETNLKTAYSNYAIGKWK